jgi:acyl phosphate:glycerol-3-phosphate acyltransferase
MLPVLFGYLAGSVPFAFLLARRAGIDVRIAGSGNVGAANVLRTAGARRALLVMLLDVAKGAAAVVLAHAAIGGVGRGGGGGGGGGGG